MSCIWSMESKIKPIEDATQKFPSSKKIRWSLDLVFILDHERWKVQDSSLRADSGFSDSLSDTATKILEATGVEFWSCWCVWLMIRFDKESRVKKYSQWSTFPQLLSCCTSTKNLLVTAISDIAISWSLLYIREWGVETSLQSYWSKNEKKSMHSSF